MIGVVIYCNHQCHDNMKNNQANEATNKQRLFWDPLNIKLKKLDFKAQYISFA